MTSEGERPPWDKAGVHGLQRLREWDEVVTVEADAPGDHAEFVVVAPDDAPPLAAALTLAPPYRAEAVRRGPRVWAVAARRIEVAVLPGIEGDELEQTRRGNEVSLRIDGAERLGWFAPLELPGDYAARGRRLQGDLWEIERSLL